MLDPPWPDYLSLSGPLVGAATVTKIWSIHEAKTHLSRLLERVERGEEVFIARNGEPVARLVPVSKAPRRWGRLAGRLTIGADFDAPLPEQIRKAFEAEAP